jgi:hypothetical protein
MQQSLLTKPSTTDTDDVQLGMSTTCSCIELLQMGRHNMLRDLIMCHAEDVQRFK